MLSVALLSIRYLTQLPLISRWRSDNLCSARALCSRRWNSSRIFVAGEHASFPLGEDSDIPLEDLARRLVIKRLASCSSRNDILGKLIQARGYGTSPPTTDEIAELTAKSVTLL